MLGTLSVMELVSSLVRTDSKCLFRIFAQLGLSLIMHQSSFLSGGTHDAF